MIGDRIRLARRKAGLSLRELSAAMRGKVTAQAIGKYERGEDVPSSGVLMALAARPSLSEAVMGGLLRASGSINSSYERSRLLLAILKTHNLSPASRQLFLDAAQGITSSHEQNQVLAELVRSERRAR